MTPQDIDRIYLTSYSKLHHAKKYLSKCGLYKYVIHNTIYKTISLLRKYNRNSPTGINKNYRKRRRNMFEDNMHRLYVLV